MTLHKILTRECINMKIASTLTDADIYTKDELAELYLALGFWSCSIAKSRRFKVGMEKLRCRTR